jgi:hypothetical protein
LRFFSFFFRRIFGWLHMRHQRALLSAKHQGITFQAVDNLTTAESLQLCGI